MSMMMKKNRLAAVLAMTAMLAICGCEHDTIAAEAADETVTAAGSVTTVLDVTDQFTKRDASAEYDAASSVQIFLTGDSAEAASDAVQISGSTVTVVAEGTYVLSGTLNGMVVVDADSSAKVQLVLNGAEISSATSAAIYVKQADKVFITLADGTQNVLTNGGSFTAVDENDIDAVIFSKEDLTLNGSGHVAVSTTAGHGIVSKDDLVVTGGTYVVEASAHGFSGKDSVRIADGSFSVTSGKDAIHAENNEDTAKGYVYIEGGSFTLTAEGDGISASGDLVIQDGKFEIVTAGGAENAVSHTGGFGGGAPFIMKGETGTEMPRIPGGMSRDDFPGRGGQMMMPESQQQDMSGTGNEGETNPLPPVNGTLNPEENAGSATADTKNDSTKGLKADGNVMVNGGTFSINSADDALHSNADAAVNGGRFTVASGDDAFHAGGLLEINSGTIEITQSYEGLEGLSITVNGGEIKLTASDDGLNAAGGNDRSGTFGGDMFAVNEDCLITINGGTLSVNAAGDGVDSNGNVLVTGGKTIVYGPANNGNASFDYNGTATITGGTFLAAGSAGMAQNFTGAENQAAIMVNVGNQAAGTTVTVTDAQGNTVLNFTPEKAFGNVVLSVEQLQAGSTYTVTAGTYTEEITLEGNLYGTAGMGGFGGFNGQMGGQPGSFGGRHRNMEQNGEMPLQPGAETVTR